MLKKLSLGLVIVGLTTETLAAYQMTVPQAFYYYAQRGDFAGIQKLKLQGYSIDSSNMNGNSALCESVYRQDYSSFALLRQAGASTKHSCMSRIPSETVNQFNKGYIKWAEAVNSGKISYAGATTQTTRTTATAKAATATTGSEGGSVLASVPTWAWWTGGALLVAGGAAAIAGGGGGGGHKDRTPTLIGKIANNNNDGIIELENGQNRDVIGLYNETGSSAYGAYANSETTNTTSIITTNNVSDGNIYGIYQNSGGQTAGAKGAGLGSITDRIVSNVISQRNSGNGNVYGIWAADGLQNTYGATESNNKNMTLTNTITQVNLGNGNVYGIYGTDVRGASTTGSLSSSHTGNIAKNIISISNIGKGTAYGLYGRSSAMSSVITNSSENTDLNSITITSAGGNAVGMYGGRSVTNASDDTIMLNYLGGNYTKTYQDNADETQTETVSIETDNTYVAGIYVPQNASATNAGDIVIKREAWTDDNGTDDTSDDVTYTSTGTTGTAFGIYVEGSNTSSKTITNSGTITISGIDNAYGIYVADGTNVTVQNTGTITIDGESKTNDSTPDGKFIVLNGGTLMNSNSIGASTLNLASMGGTVVATTGASFHADNEISGTLNVSADLTTQGFNTTYVEKDMINARDTSGLKLVSESALFDAKLADNGHDVVMNMKSFDTVTKNASFAKFLTQNYARANNEKFFNMLKEMATKSALTDAFDKLMGKEMLSRFAFEDMTMMRELNFDMNNNLFNMKEDHLSMAGSVSSPMAFKGDTGSNSRYTLINKSDGIWSVGLGIAFTDTRSDDDDKENARSDSMYQMIVPIGYKAGGFKFMTSPRLGYARGTYNRAGFNDKTYDGTIEKRIFGLMNEARYPMTFEDWRFEPTAEFNMLGYEQKGHEEEKEYSLYIPTQRTYSVESGIGLYATHETSINENSKMKFMAGASAYHEFTDPYKMDVEMNGMNGTFTLRDEKRTDNRAVVRAGFNYDTNGYGISASVISYIDRETRTKANLGFKWKF